MKITTLDGTRFEAQDAADLVHQMHEASYAPCSTDEEFMDEMAERIKLMYGRWICSINAETFVSDLTDIGFLKQSDEGEKK